MADNASTSATLEGKSSALFLAAGGLLVVFAANTGLETFAGTFYPPVQDVVGPAGFFVGVVGLFGLYPALADRTPTMARVAAAVAAVAALCWFVIVVGGLGDLVGVTSGVDAIVPAVFFIGVFAFTILAYVAFGLTSLRASVHSRTVSVLLFGPAVTFLLLIVGAAPNFVVDAGHVLVYLGIGIALRAEGVSAERAPPAPDSTA